MDIPQKNGPTRPSLTLNLPLIGAFVVLVLVGAGVVFFLTSSRTIPVLPVAASTQAKNTDGLFYGLLGVGGIVFFLVQGLLLYSVIRFRAKPNDLTDGPSIHGNPTLEIVWTIIPAIVVVVLSLASLSVWTGNVATQDNENFIDGRTVDIQVRAKRFQWSFLYQTGELDVDGNPIVVTSPQLHTYEKENVWLQMNAEDVIHSFWVPEMRVKQDVMPGKTTELRFTPINPGFDYTFAYEYPDDKPLGVIVPIPADRAGDTTIDNRFNQYDIVCTELCGGGHGDMRAALIVHENEESFMVWYNAQVENKRNPPDDPVILGQQLLDTAVYQCASCHTLSSLGWTGDEGPDLSEIAVRAGKRAQDTGEETGAAYIIHSIRHSTDYVVAGFQPVMPSFQDQDTAITNYMPDDHLVGLVAFLCTQTNSETVAADSTCGLEFGEDNVLVDVDATVDTLLQLAEEIDPNS